MALSSPEPVLPGDDPGWRRAWRHVVWHLLPWVGFARSQRQPDGLVALRGAFLSFLVALLGIGGVVAFLAAGQTKTPAVPAALGVALVGAVGVAGLLAIRLRDRRLDCSSDMALAASYRTRFFFRVAASESPALAGFVAFFLTTNPAMYALGLLFAAVGFATLAPTAGQLEHDQRELVATGCARSLLAALGVESSQPPPPR